MTYLNLWGNKPRNTEARNDPERPRLTTPRCSCGLIKVKNAYGCYYCAICRPATPAAKPVKPAPAPEPPKAPTPPPAAPLRREVVAALQYTGHGVSVINPRRLERGYLRAGEPLYVTPIYNLPAALEEDDAAA